MLAVSRTCIILKISSKIYSVERLRIEKDRETQRKKVTVSHIVKKKKKERNKSLVSYRASQISQNVLRLIKQQCMVARVNYTGHETPVKTNGSNRR